MNPPTPFTEIQISVRDMPDVDRKAKCALPVLISAADHPEFPGIHGTCIAVRHRGKTAFITAGHVLSTTEGIRIHVPLGFGAQAASCEIRELLFPVHSSERYETACDVAAMLPVDEPSFTEGETEPLDMSRVARLPPAPPKALFAVAGYPRSDPTKNVVDYELRSASFNLYHAVGTYAGPGLFDGCHTLDLSTEEVGGPQGLSGSPVFRCRLDEAGAWTAAFAGVVTHGGPRKIQFVDVEWLAHFLMSDVFHD